MYQQDNRDAYFERKEEEKEARRDRWRLTMGLMEFLAVVAGVAVTLVLVLLRGNYAYKAISQYGFSNWLDTQLDSPVYMVLTILIVAGLLAGGIASMISVRREGKKIKELKRRRMIEE